MAAAPFNLDQFLAVVSLIAPVLLMAVPGGAGIAVLIPTIVNAIKEAEQIQGATGPEKKAHVLAIVMAAVAVANATGSVKLNPEEVNTVAGYAIDVVIGTIHIIEGAKVIKVDVPNVEAG
jgi:hypothetical protein